MTKADAIKAAKASLKEKEKRAKEWRAKFDKAAKAGASRRTLRILQGKAEKFEHIVANTELKIAKAEGK